MYQIFNKAGLKIEFSDESAVDVSTFILELSKFCHLESEATASRILALERDVEGESSLVWQEQTGDEVELLEALNPHLFLKQQVTLALENASEKCYRHSRLTGEIQSIDSVAYWKTENGHESEQDADTVTDHQSNVPVLQRPLPEQLHSSEHDSILWVRPLSNIHVLLSICPITSKDTPLLHMIKTAYEIREQFISARKALQESTNTRRVLRLAETISEKLPIADQAYAMANEIRNFMACDRVSIFEVNNADAKVIAVSGQPKFNKRSNSIRTGQQMVGKMARTGEPFWFTGDFSELADSMKGSVRKYTDESLVNSFAMLPLVQFKKPVYPSEDEIMLEAIHTGSASTQKVIGAVLVEQIEDVIETEIFEQNWEQIHSLVLNQYSNARRYDSIFLIRLWTLLGRFGALYRGQTKRKAILITALISILLLGSFLIPSDFKLRCEGYLVFENTLDMYSQGEGEVVKLNAFDGKEVQKGDVLMVQENLSLQKEFAQLEGEIAQKRVEVDDLNDSRTQKLFSADNATEDLTVDIASKVNQLEAELSELDERRSLTLNELENHVVRAPFDATITGWKTERRLLNRPLEKGVHLFTLIPSDTPFQLELRVPDQRAGYVQSAWRKANEEDRDLPVIYRLASAPGNDRKAKVTFVSPGLERDEHIGYTLPIYAVTIDEIPEYQKKSRTAVLAKVICGRRSFAYCKSYEVIDWLSSKWFEFSL